MPIEFKDFLKEIDLPEDLAEKEIDDIKEAFHGVFVSRTVLSDPKNPDIQKFVSKAIGHRMGSIDTILNTEFGLSKAETSEMTVEEKIKLAGKNVKDKIKEYESGGTHGGDEELKKKLEKVTGELTQHKELLTQSKQTLEQKEQEWTSTLKNKTRDIHLRDIKTKIPVVDQPDPYKLRGVDAEISEKYAFELDDEEKLIVKDKTGNLVQNEKKTGFLSAEDVYKLEYQKAGLLKMNSGGTTKTNAGTKTTTNQAQPIPGRKLPESAIRNANR